MTFTEIIAILKDIAWGPWMLILLGGTGVYFTVRLKLLQFSKEQQMKILAFNLTERHARAISRLPREKQDKALDYIIRNNLNVSRTDRYVNSILSPKQKHRQTTKINIKDIRIFTNTITKAVKLMQSAGINAGYRQNEDENYIHYSVTVPKKHQSV